MISKTETYITRQAVTVGRRARRVNYPIWVPQLSGVDGHCLGVIGKSCEPNRVDAGRGIAITSTGVAIITGSFNGQLRCYNLRKGTLTWQNSDKNCGVITDITCSPKSDMVATGSSDGIIRLWNVDTGQLIRCFKRYSDIIVKVRWSPIDDCLVSTSEDKVIRIWDVNTGRCVRQINCDTWAIDWFPGGRFIASGDWEGEICIWDTISGEIMNPRRVREKESVYAVSWSPNGAYLATQVLGGIISIWDIKSYYRVLQWKAHEGEKGGFCVAWSPDGRLLASGSNDNTIRIWNSRTSEELKCFNVPKLDWSSGGPFILNVVWSPGGEFMASSGKDDIFRLWDTRHLIQQSTDTFVDTSPDTTVPSHLRVLPLALVQLHRLKIYPPLSVISDLINLTGGKSTAAPLSFLMNASCSKLTELCWPSQARIGLASLLLHNIPFPDEYKPPPNTTAPEIRDVLSIALSGDPIDPQAPPLPMALLTEAAKKIDDRLISLLHMIGPEAVAADPGLPLRLLHNAKNLPPMTSEQRRLLSLRVSFSGASGQSIGTDPGADRGQVGGVEMGSMRTDWRSLLPSQLVMSGSQLAYRHLRGELLFRAREIAEPHRLRPTVLLLDVSPPTFGPVESVTRLAAFIVARSLRHAGIPVLLITSGGNSSARETVRELEHSTDLVEIWTQRTLKPADPVRSLRLANAVRSTLRNGAGPEPTILLLTHPWFGAEDPLPTIKGLRGLFVQYPSHHSCPAMADACERWESVLPEQTAGLEKILGHLIG